MLFDGKKIINMIPKSAVFWVHFMLLSSPNEIFLPKLTVYI